MTLDPAWVPKSWGRSSRRWKTIRKQALRRDMAANAPCWICGKPIDYTLTGGPWCWQPDHYLSVREHPELAEDIGNLRPSHARCNNQRGQEERLKRSPRKAKPSGELGEGSEDWGF